MARGKCGTADLPAPKAGTGISTKIKRSRVAAKELDGGSDLTPAMINEERAVAVEARNWFVSSCPTSKLPLNARPTSACCKTQPDESMRTDLRCNSLTSQTRNIPQCSLVVALWVSSLDNKHTHKARKCDDVRLRWRFKSVASLVRLSTGLQNTDVDQDVMDHRIMNRKRKVPWIGSGPIYCETRLAYLNHWLWHHVGPVPLDLGDRKPQLHRVLKRNRLRFRCPCVTWRYLKRVHVYMRWYH